MVIVECIGCAFGNRVGISDSCPAGDARGNVVRGRWPTSGRGAGCSGEPSLQQNGALLRDCENNIRLETDPSGLDREQTHRAQQTHAVTASSPDGFRG